MTLRMSSQGFDSLTEHSCFSIRKEKQMNCKNCGGSGGKKGNRHVKGRAFTCTRWSSSGDRMPDVSLGGLSDWSSSDESSGGTGGSYDSGGYSCGGGLSD